MMKKSALYEQITLLEDEIKNFLDRKIAVEKLWIYTHSVSNGYYNGASSGVATTDEMDLISFKLKFCFEELSSIYKDEKSKMNKEDSEKLRGTISVLENVMEEVIRRVKERGQ